MYIIMVKIWPASLHLCLINLVVSNSGACRCVKGSLKPASNYLIRTLVLFLFNLNFTKLSMQNYLICFQWTAFYISHLCGSQEQPLQTSFTVLCYFCLYYYFIIIVIIHIFSFVLINIEKYKEQQNPTPPLPDSPMESLRQRALLKKAQKRAIAMMGQFIKYLILTFLQNCN